MAFLRLALDVRVLLLLAVGFLAAASVGFVVSRRMNVSRLHLSTSLASFWLIVVAMFFVGRGDPQYKGLHLEDAVSCVLVDSLEGFTGWNSEAVLNVILYIPFAISLMLLTRKLWVVLAGGIAIAVLLEFLQVLTSWGACGGPDFVRNAIGVLLGAVPTWAILHTSKRRTKDKEGAEVS